MFRVRLITPKGLYEETKNVTLLNVVTLDGQRGLLSNHMPIVMMLVVSKLTIVHGKSRVDYAITRGMLYFKDNLAIVLVDAIESKVTIDVARAIKAKEKALRMLNEEVSEWELNRARYSLEKANNRLKVAGATNEVHEH